MKEKKTTLVGWGPTNEEEAIARIEAIEADIEKNGLIDEEEMIEHLKVKGLWLGYIEYTIRIPTAAAEK